jgi:serine/threonine protein kinase/Tol biopolymer transport system component
MAVGVGTRIGPYEILAALGAGGMGEVYKARDTQLDRDIAIKILPDMFATDPERVARFSREAKTLAALNHPHIAQIYGLEGLDRRDGLDGTAFLVMELVEGEDLAQRIARGPIPHDEALPIARQIADALAAAHEQGIIHRDLKPANIKVRDDGTVKVLDFGLAKAIEHASRGIRTQPEVSASPTITSPAIMTGVGIILGTAAYMAPEQARGRPIDKRADIWAFGCVLFEMLTGKRAFPGEDVSDMLAKVLERDPDFDALPSNCPASIRRLLRRCLEKDRRRRLDSIADARLDIDDALSAPEQPTGARPLRAIPRERIAWAAAVIVSLTIAAALGRAAYLSRGSPPAETPPEMRLEIVTPGGSLTHFALSPDGRLLVYQATVDNRTQLWLRPLDAEAAQPLAGTDGATFPFWAPDSQSVAFFADLQLKRIDLAGGVVRTLARAPYGFGGAWSAQGSILFSPSQTGPLSRVPAGGGNAVEVRVDAKGQTGSRSPCFLPDGRHFLFYGVGSPETRGVYIGSIDSTDTQRLLDDYSAPVCAPPDRVLFGRQGVLMAQRLDDATRRLTGDPVAAAKRVVIDPNTSGPLHAVSASFAGPVAYRASAPERQLTWLDRSGRPVGIVGGPDAFQPTGIRLSPDGRTVGLFRTVNGNADAWLLETTRGIFRRLTTDPAVDYFPIWSPDGSRTVFGSNRLAGAQDLYEKPIAGDAPETLLLATSEPKIPRDWSSDGRFILYQNQSAKTGFDLWVLPLIGDRTPWAVAQTSFNENNGRFSPDGRWLAYQSNESGRTEIYVQAFPASGGKSQISTTGGTGPVWRPDGRELFYVTSGQLMAVPVTPNGSKVDAGTPVALFPVPVGVGYDVSADGQRFLVVPVTKEASPITVLLNWKLPEVK